MKNNDFDDIDSLIDKALESYVAGEPRGGLENRILSRIQAEDAAGKLAFRWWVWAFPVLAFVVFGVVRSSDHTAKLPLREAVAARPDPPGSILDPGGAEPLFRARPPGRALARRTVRKPKQSVFPAATPLSDAERALVAFVKIAPNDEVSALVEERKRSIAPIQIDSIKITPLQSDGAQ